MTSRSRHPRRLLQAAIGLPAALALLTACGGGGQAQSGPEAAPQEKAAAAKSRAGSHGVTVDPVTGDLVGTNKPNLVRGSDAADTLRGLAGHDNLIGGAGDDVLYGGAGRDRMAGGPGDDRYIVTDLRDKVVERASEGIDSVITTVSFTLPAHVENLYADEPAAPGLVLTGNALDNHIVGGPFSEDVIYGMDGNDTLDGGGRIGGHLDGGNGNDRLLISFGVLVGGPGADTFVAAGRGAMTSPDVAIVVRDFNGAEGDRIEIVQPQAADAAALFASGQLRFDTATSRLILDMDPSTTAPTSVDQIFILEGVTRFDPTWVSITARS